MTDSMVNPVDQDSYALEGDLGDAIVDALCDGSLWPINHRYEIEEAEDDTEPLVLVAKADGSRWRLEIEVYATKLPPLGVPEVHPGQMALPLSGGSDATA